ncbi:MAG TPA: Gfo/Idh/MocA family oxidoreductase [Armatimonadota bacterium]|nr:Gfo/Idh/MocA family oxidoreductase [Armatimonadota bacterium]
MDKLDGLSRRGFLKSVATAAVAAHVGMTAVRAQDEAPAAPEAPPFRFGLIGCGGQGRVALMGSAKRIPGVQFVGVCDIRQENLDRAKEQAGEGAQTFTDYREMINNLEMDAVIVATPLTLHRDITVAALEKGLPVFCEKCMAYTVDQCKDMLRAQQAAGKTLQIGHHLRYHPLYHHAKKAFIGTGLLGDITAVYGQWNRNADWRRQVSEADAAGDYTAWGFDTPERLVNWRLYKDLSGGLTTELAGHQIDVVNWMLDATPSAVTGVGGIDHWKDGRTVPDNIHLTFEYPNGVKFDYQALTTNAFSMFGSECFEMIKGTKGTLVLTHLWGGPLKSKGWFFLEKGVQEELWMDAAHKEKVGENQAIILDCTVTEGTRIAGQPYDKLMDNQGNLKKPTYQLEFEEFIQSVRENKIPTCDGNVGIRSAAAALLANQAMEEQRRIEFSPDLYEL